MWYRVFGGNSRLPTPESIREFLVGAGGIVLGDFVADASGWYRADLVVNGVTLQLERYLADEEGIRAELNGWAAWLETRAAESQHVSLMERAIQTTQLFTLHCQSETAQAERLGVGLCGFLAHVTEGVYQIDEQGFFDAEGTLLVRES
jgi:hypothetical protein